MNIAFLAPCDYKATSISKHQEMAPPVVYESLDIVGEYHHGATYKHVNATRQTRKEIKSFPELIDNASVATFSSLQNYVHILVINAIFVSIRMLSA